MTKQEKVKSISAWNEIEEALASLSRLNKNDASYYHYLEAIDGQTVHNLNIIAPLEEDSFIDKEQFSIFYLDDQLKKVPLYIHQYKESRFYKSCLLQY